MRIKITTEAACDLPPELIERYDIGILAGVIIKGDQQYHDMVDITPDDIFDYVENGDDICHTAAINFADYDEFFSKFMGDYDAIVHITLSSGLSITHQNGVIYAAEHPNIYIVDSKNLSTGIGYTVLKAAEMAEAGMSPDEIVERLNEITAKMEVSFVIDTIKYLYKGGRCSALAMLGANVLKLKPCIEVIDGKMDVGKKYRGTFDKVILQYVSDRLSNRDDIDTGRIFVTHPGATPKEIVDSVLSKISSILHFDEVIETCTGCTIANHCGPICLGIIFQKK